MQAATSPGQVIILNGAPRSGKSSIAAVIQATFDGFWINLGVDASIAMTPPQYRPGIGLRPGGERPDLEVHLPALFAALYASIAAHSRQGLNVVTDIGHHSAYATPALQQHRILRDCAALLHDQRVPTLVVGVRCPLDIIMQRRNATAASSTHASHYVTSTPDDLIPALVRRWQHTVHQPGIYDLELNTAHRTPHQCAAAIHQHLHHGPPPTALTRLATLNIPPATDS